MRGVTMFKQGRMLLVHISVILAVVFLQACAALDRRAVPEIQYFGIAEQTLLPPLADAVPGLKVMTFQYGAWSRRQLPPAVAVNRNNTY